MAEWDRDARGMITLRPLAGYETAVVAETACALRIEHASGSEASADRAVVQLVLTPGQAKALAGALVRMAEQIERPAPPGVRTN